VSLSLWRDQCLLYVVYIIEAGYAGILQKRLGGVKMGAGLAKKAWSIKSHRVTKSEAETIIYLSVQYALLH
jgi:hypothetical protein